jgi:predicted SprT family Zn-dependent metalloprotease
MSMQKILKNKRYGNVVVIEELKNKNILIKCDCGNEYIIKRASISKYNKKNYSCRKCFYNMITKQQIIDDLYCIQQDE